MKIDYNSFDVESCNFSKITSSKPKKEYNEEYKDKKRKKKGKKDYTEQRNRKRGEIQD